MRLVDILEAPLHFLEWLGDGGFMWLFAAGLLCCALFAVRVDNFYGPDGKNGTATSDIVDSLAESDGPPYTPTTIPWHER